jgi:PII-like signaling protein
MPKGKLLRIHLTESDRFEGKPMSEAIVAKCRENQIAGVTVLRGLEGYGHLGDMHRAHFLARDRPLVVMIIDAPEAIERFVPVIEGMLDRGLFAVSDVETIRVEKGTV